MAKALFYQVFFMAWHKHKYTRKNAGYAVPFCAFGGDAEYNRKTAVPEKRGIKKNMGKGFNQLALILTSLWKKGGVTK